MVIFLILMVIKVPIAFSLGLSCAYYFISNGVPLETFSQIMLSAFDSFPLLAIPLFMLAGMIMNMGGVTHRLFDFAKTLVGHIPGGLGHVNIVTSLIFAGMSGSATADSAGLGTIEIEYMKKEKYDPAFSAAVTAASSTVGPIMPPSIGFVLYGSLTGASIGRLFIGGAIPAFIMSAGMMLVVYLIARKHSYKTYPKPTFRQLFSSFKLAVVPMLTPVIILGGIITGIVTPTEAAVFAILYAIFLGTCVYKEIGLKKLVSIFVEVGKGCSKLMLIVSFAFVFGWILTYEGIPAKLAKLLFAVSSNKYVILFIIDILILVLGCFMEGLSIVLIVIPVLLPVLKLTGIDLVHFGVVQSLANNIGLITPPVGICAYIVADIAQVKFEKVIRALVPFMVILVVVLFIITYIPQTVLWLPNLLMGAS